MPRNLQNIREDILGVTRAMIAESGHADLSIRNIAAKCGIGTGTFYNYFSSKQEVVAAILLHEWEIALRRMDKGARTYSDCSERLKQIFVELSSFVQSIHSIWLDDSWYEPGSYDMDQIHRMKQETRNQLALKIREVLQSQVEEQDEAFFADALTRLFLSYSADKSFDFADLEHLIRKLVKQG